MDGEALEERASPGTRKAAELRTRRAVLVAARKVFLREGYENARMADVSAEAGVAVGTPYHHYGSKEGLARALAEEFLGRVFDAIGPELFDTRRPLDVARVVRRALEVAGEDAELFRMGLGRLPGRPAVGVVEESRARLESALRERMALGQVRRYDDAQALADILISLLRRAILVNSLPEERASLPEASYEATLVDALERILSP